jgi:hypothetical protein
VHGTVKKKVEPTPTPLSTHIRPPCRDNLCRNKEAQPKAREGLVLWITHTKEALKDVFVFLWGNANAKILHADDGGIRIK